MNPTLPNTPIPEEENADNLTVLLIQLLICIY